ncbi:MAG: GNAT family N-acetyltransferase [archaeon]|nr:GNAT family N-acetyltransferase [archaeon]
MKTVMQTIRLLGDMDALHLKHMGSTPHCYLAFIGTASSMRGTGLGSRMARHTLAAIDAAHLPCYLENSNPKNLPFYQRLGFNVIEQHIPDGVGPPMFIMLRPAASSSIPLALSSMVQSNPGGPPLTVQQREIATDLVVRATEVRHRSTRWLFTPLNLWILAFLFCIFGFIYTARRDLSYEFE